MGRVVHATKMENVSTAQLKALMMDLILLSPPSKPTN
jgi:hypothetical protein